jgi:hypothetical protein
MELKARHAKKTMGLLFFICGLFVAGAAVICIATTPYSLGWWSGFLSASFFALCGVIFVRRLLDSKDALTISARGVLDTRVADRVIPWSAIRSASERSVKGVPYLLLQLSRPSADFIDGRYKRFVVAMNRLFGFGDIYIALTGLDAPSHSIAAIFRHYKKF